jgi:hypothetical protein
MRRVAAGGTALAVAFAAGVALGADRGAAHTRREPQFENEHVRVWKSIIMPNQPLALHRHDHGRTSIALRMERWTSWTARAGRSRC